MQISYDSYEKEKQFHGELWEIRKKYYFGEDNLEFWAALHADLYTLHEKYQNEYLDQQIICCIYDIDRRFRISTGSQYVDSNPVKTMYECLVNQKWKQVKA